MPANSAKKLFVGPRFRRIRHQLGLSQTQMAEGLEISPSYINLIERNQRPVTAQLLLRLAERRSVSDVRRVKCHAKSSRRGATSDRIVGASRGGGGGGERDAHTSAARWHVSLKMRASPQCDR